MLGLETDEQQRVGPHAPEDAPRWARARDWRLSVYSYSFTIVMGVIFLATWLGQSVTSLSHLQRRAERQHGEPEILVGDATSTSSDFWERSLQNWQSEFLAVGTMAVFTVYLRQRGSPESKPVGAPHTETGSSG